MAVAGIAHTIVRGKAALRPGTMPRAWLRLNVAKGVATVRRQGPSRVLFRYGGADRSNLDKYGRHIQR